MTGTSSQLRQRRVDQRAAAHLALWRPEQRASFLLLPAGFTSAYLIMTVIAVHLPTLLRAQSLAPAAAVGFGALINASQVGGRVLEMKFGKLQHPV